MKFTTPARRVLAVGAVSALAAGALVSTTATTASAAPISNDYICTSPDPEVGAFPMTLDSDIAILDPLIAAGGLGAGTDVVAGFFDVTNTVSVPTLVVQGLSGKGITRVEAPGFAGTFGNQVVGVDGVGADVADAEPSETPGFSTLQADGVNAAFEVPAAGNFDVVSPSSVDLVAKNAAGVAVTQVPCVLAEGETAGSYGTVPVVKNNSTSNAKTTKKQFKKGTAASVRVKVSAENETPGGQVLLKKKSKTLAKGKLNKKGVVVLKTKSLKVGKTKLKTVYKGDKYTKPSTDTVTVKVVR